eukprot:Selendium_serpulae@DN5505_c0_g1_i2.p1
MQKMSVGIPVKLLHEGLGHAVTFELKTGDLYRGSLVGAEDNMNCMLESVTVTSRDGKVTQIEQVYIRGSQIRFAVFPDMLRHSPMFKLAQGSRGRGRVLGLGNQRRAMAMRARAGSALLTARRQRERAANEGR